jgi:hypothetical protein
MIRCSAWVTKSVDVADLKSAAARHAGSNPAPGTIKSMPSIRLMEARPRVELGYEDLQSSA